MSAIAEIRVAIILVNWNQSNLTIECLKSLLKISFPSYTIILIDNGSKKEERDKLEKFLEDHNIEIICNDKNLGFTGGNNVGLEFALKQDFTHFMLLNNDTIVSEGFLEPLVSEFINNQEIGAVQPKINYLSEPDTIWNFGGDFNRITGNTKSRFQKTRDTIKRGISSETDWITGCCILVSRECIEDVGLLDNRYFAYYEDVDWSFRMKERGYLIRCISDSIIYHAVGASGKSKSTREGQRSPEIIRYVIRNHIFLVRRHSRGLYALTSSIYQIIKIAKFLLFYLVTGRRKKFAMVIKGIKEGLSGNQSF